MLPKVHKATCNFHDDVMGTFQIRSPSSPLNLKSIPQNSLSEMPWWYCENYEERKMLVSLINGKVCYLKLSVRELSMFVFIIIVLLKLKCITNTTLSIMCISFTISLCSPLSSAQAWLERYDWWIIKPKCKIRLLLFSCTFQYWKVFP